MKFSLGHNHDGKIFDLLARYRDHIEALYFPVELRFATPLFR